jgi:1-deoxy-D-xylulose-5-phosphate reductoisomerase
MTARQHSVTVLGSTGSIGVNTLDVLARHPQQFSVFALSGHSRIDLLFAQCLLHKPRFVVATDAQAGPVLESRLLAQGSRTRVLIGHAALDEVAAHEEVDMVMAAIVGAAGLSSCMAAARAGKRLLLANKEALVVGGTLFMDTVRTGGATLLPIDSEHSAIFQSLPGDRLLWPLVVDKIILTASGGPFRTRDPATLRDVTPQEACAHPNWSMGRKISVDSATMMNKALEVIEAKFLFGIDPSRIEVIIHPQSVVHSMVQFVDRAVVAQLGVPDMRGPIAYGLSWPQRIESGTAALDFSAVSGLTFETFESREHRQRFPGLQLAWEAMAGVSGTTAVLNAANEIAVAAFLETRIRFDHIHAVNQTTLAALSFGRPASLSEILELDARARAAAQDAVAALAH